MSSYDGNEYYKNEANAAFSKLTGGIINFFKLSRENLKSFFDVQKEKNAFSTFNLGLQEVEVKKIVGSVQKTLDFNKDFIPVNKIVEERWTNIYAKYLEDGNLPPVELYKIKDEYFVYDGNHRVSVAHALNFKNIEALVTEYVPNTGEEVDLIYNERFFFEKNTGLKNIYFSYLGGFKKLMENIESSKNYFEKDISYLELSKKWEKGIFSPISKIFSFIGNYRNLPNGNLFLRVISKMDENKNCGFLQATLEVIDYHNLSVGESLTRYFKKLEQIDSVVGKNMELTRKISELEEYVGINFKAPLKFIKQIEDCETKDNYKFEEKISYWYENIFLIRYSLIENKIKNLPVRYKEPWIKIDDAEKINLELIEYEKIFATKYSRKFSELELIFCYVLEIYIPILELMKLKKDSEFYYSVSNKYKQLHDYKKIVTIEEAFEQVKK
ncbi:MAG: hypothetical protein ACRCSK_07580 [Fusobacteriaceae bacterium]